MMEMLNNPLVWLIAIIIIAGIAFLIIRKTSAKGKSGGKVVGMTFTLEEEVSTDKPGKILWSGVTWKAVLDEDANCDSIAKGEEVEVIIITTGKMTVVPVNN